jgi:hypothetical protein
VRTVAEKAGIAGANAEVVKQPFDKIIDHFFLKSQVVV